jgi:hypothetical protein
MYCGLDYFLYLCSYQLKIEIMEKDLEITEVIFRKFKNGEIIALFPHEVWVTNGNVTSYMHVGQHGGADYTHVLSKTKLATPTEALPLYTELESIGYNLMVIKKRNYDKYLKSYREKT